MRPIAFLLMFVAASAFAGAVYTPPVLLGAGSGSGRRSTAPIPFPDPKSQWVRASMPHFEVISAAGEKRTRAIAQNLETLAAALAALQPRFQTTSTPTRVLIFNRRRDSQPYFDLL